MRALASFRSSNIVKANTDIYQTCVCVPQLVLTMGNVGDCAIVLDVDVEPVRPEVLGHNRAWGYDSVGFGQLALRKVLVQWPGQYWLNFGLERPGSSPWPSLTISLEVSSSVIFLPTNLLVHSSVLLSGWLVTPGTTRGMLGDAFRIGCLGNLL